MIATVTEVLLVAGYFAFGFAAVALLVGAALRFFK